jgi:hypothetical protein
MFYTASPSSRNSLYSKALEIVATLGSTAKHYVRVMEMVRTYELSPTSMPKLTFFSFYFHHTSKRNLSPQA